MAEENQKQEAIAILQNGGIGVMPTDTLYGVVARAEDEKAVERVYKIKGRMSAKPFIVLIHNQSELVNFSIKPSLQQKSFLSRIWPGRVSVVLPCNDERLQYLHRGTDSLALRVPKDAHVRELVKETGALVVPSANPEGKPPATTAQEARNYFGNSVDFYLDGGTLTSPPSTLVSLIKETPEVMREGVVSAQAIQNFYKESV